MHLRPAPASVLGASGLCFTAESNVAAFLPGSRTEPFAEGLAARWTVATGTETKVDAQNKAASMFGSRTPELKWT